MIWQGQVQLDLTDGSTTGDAAVTSLFISDNGDVYAGGFEYTKDAGISVAKYWKNSNVTALTDGTKDAKVNSIFVVGSDVYACGYEVNGYGKRNAKYWKNGVATTIITISNQSSELNSIFVLQ